MNRLLLVEDDAFTGELVCRALERAGVEADVTVARSGEEALERARGMVQAGAAPDAVLLDLRPQGTGGLDVLAALRAVPGLSRCPVVVYTGSATPSDGAAARAAGADGFFVKPDAFGDLVDRMRELGRWFGPATISNDGSGAGPGLAGPPVSRAARPAVGGRPESLLNGPGGRRDAPPAMLRGRRGRGPGPASARC